MQEASSKFAVLGICVYCVAELINVLNLAIVDDEQTKIEYYTFRAGFFCIQTQSTSDKYAFSLSKVTKFVASLWTYLGRIHFTVESMLVISLPFAKKRPRNCLRSTSPVDDEQYLGSGDKFVW